MALITNELAELYNPEDFEPPKNPFAKYAKMPASRLDYEPVRARAKPGKVYDKECGICHEPFATGHKDQKYCSDECRKEAKRRRNAKRRRGAIAASSLSVVLALVFPSAACADEPLEVMDLPLRHAIAGGSMSHGMAAIVEPTIPAEPEEAWQEPEEPVGYDVGYVTETARLDAAYYGDGTDAAYGENGPTREMPGYHDGRKETYYSSNVLPHYRMGEWTVDDDGFYRTTDGYYVVGVGIDEGYEIGDTFEGGRGTCVVMDYGYTENITDYYTAW